MRNKNLKFKISEGFTLIELLVVIVIIGILASFLMTNYIGVRMRARDTQRKSDLRQIQSALEMYRSDVGVYPAALPVCGGQLTNAGVIYMRKIPCDPIVPVAAPFIYRYRPAFANSAYTIAGCLENINDLQKDSINNPVRVDGGASITACVPASNRSYTLFSP